MANATFNAGIDYFGLETASSNQIKVKSSAENRSKQSTSGANTAGDAVVVDSWGETAAPSAEYDVVDAITQAIFPELGSVNTPSGFTNPVVLGTVTISTQNGSAPTRLMSSQAMATTARPSLAKTAVISGFEKRYRGYPTAMHPRMTYRKYQPVLSP